MVREMRKIMGQMKIISCEPLVSDIKELIHRKQYHVLQVLNKYVINSHCELACMWLFLRICRHSANAVTEMKRSGIEGEERPARTN